MKRNSKKCTAIAVGFVGSLLWGITCIIENQNAIAQVGGIFIRNELSNKCIDVAGDPATNNGATLRIFDCELSGISSSGRITDQKWEFIRGGFIRNKLSNRCMDVSGDPGIANDTQLILSDCELSGFSSSGQPTDQRWEYIGAGFIRNGLSNKCIDVSGDPGILNRPLKLLECELSGFSGTGNTSDQRWRWEPRF
ncbi:MAG TPA: RICIN domain-containing protein [Nostoc sp.]|nr:RICIN domain-containing protein [Nostoc sp.]